MLSGAGNECVKQEKTVCKTVSGVGGSASNYAMDNIMSYQQLYHTRVQ